MSCYRQQANGTSLVSEDSWLHWNPYDCRCIELLSEEPDDWNSEVVERAIDAHQG